MDPNQIEKDEQPPPMPPNGETSDPQNSRKGSGSSLAEMERMRKEIRQLQEKRAAAMMNEVVELQREKDAALGRIKLLRQSLEGRPGHTKVEFLAHDMYNMG